MNPLDLKSLRLYVSVCDHRSMAKAAEQAHIEPSAVSKRIAQLESNLKAELLARGRRGVHLTAAGEAVLEHARDVLFAADRLSSVAAEFGSGVVGHVRLIATASAVAESLLDDIAAFMREPANGNIRIDVEERHSRDLVTSVRGGMASLGVCWDTVDLGGLKHRPYRQDRLALAVHVDHPLAGRETLSFEQTLDFDHVGLPPNSAMHTMLTRAAGRLGRSVSYRAVVSNFDAAFRVVAANLAVSIVPIEVGSHFGRSDSIRLIALSDSWAARRFAICFVEEQRLPRAAGMLLEHLVERGAGQSSDSSTRSSAGA